MLAPFDFTAKKQAELQIMIDEWVTLLTNAHVSFSLATVADENNMTIFY